MGRGIARAQLKSKNVSSAAARIRRVEVSIIVKRGIPRAVFEKLIVGGASCAKVGSTPFGALSVVVEIEEVRKGVKIQTNVSDV